jgi:hypothetical protein
MSLKHPMAVQVIRVGLFAGKANFWRFRVEVEAIAQLNQPRIVPVHGVW